MDQKTKLTIIGGVVLLIIAAVLVTFFYFGRISKNTGGTPNSGTNPLSQLPTTSSSTTPAPSGAANANSRKTFTGAGFTLTYPNNWGILTCSNSENFELDPTSSVDTKNVVCDTAVKPITVLVVNRLSCTGETVTLGPNKVIKSKATTDTGVNYRWCVAIGNKGLDITHRVSSTGSRATSKEDFSSQVEEMIKTIKATPQGS